MGKFITRRDTAMAIQCNMGGLDRTVRVIIGCALLYVTLVDSELIANQVLRYVLLALGCVNIVTAIIANCPLYTLANISTKGQRQT
jgi:hypothetical protein